MNGISGYWLRSRTLSVGWVSDCVAVCYEYSYPAPYVYRVHYETPVKIRISFEI